MRLSNVDKETIQHQFDAFCKMVLAGEAKTYYKEMKRQSMHEISLSEITSAEAEKISQKYGLDEYQSDYHHFSILGFDIAVKDTLMGEAISALPERKRDIVLMSYFLDMSDTEIAKYLDLARSTIHHHRTSSINLLREIMKGGRNYDGNT